MKKIILLLIVSFATASVFAQDTYLKWAKQFAGTSILTYSRGFAVETDADSNVYSVGIFTGTVDFDPGPGIFNLTPISTDVYISKLDAAGNFLWAKQITGSFGTLSQSFTLDKDNNIYITGTFQATVDFDLGPGVFNMTAGGVTDLFILKLTADGDFIWAKQIGNAPATAESYATTTDSFGNVYFAGGYRRSLDFDPGPGTFILTSITTTLYDAFICKLNASGDFVWARSIGGTIEADATDIRIDKLDNIYIGGNYMGTVDFDPGPGIFNLTSNGIGEIFILKLNAAGDFIWARSIGGADIDALSEITTDDAENVYATGFFKGISDFDPGPATFNLTSVGSYAVFILKLDAPGNFVWAKKMGASFANSQGMSITLDKLGNIYTTGSFIGPADFDPGPGVFILNSTGADMFISKLNNNGNFVWAKSLGGASPRDLAYAITVDKLMNVYTTGQFGSTVDFDLETQAYYLTAIPVTDAFVLKVAQCAVPIYTNIDADICSGQFYYAGGANQTTTGVYRDTLLTLIGCDSVIITNLTVHPNPNPDLGPDRKICTNERVIITPGIFSNYLWQDNSAQPSLTINNAGKYWVTVINANNCSASDTLNISGLDTIPRNFLPDDQELCYGNILRISVPNYFTYQWSTGSIDDFIDINNFGIYYLTVKDFNSCTGTDSIAIRRKDCVYMGIPNAFTPDGDFLNDIFKPVINQVIKSFSFIIFNRYGQTVFETRDYGKGWDGTFKGEKQPSGSYVYRIKYTNIFGVETVENGSVLLIR